MQASLRIWILCIIIAVAVYYLYIKHTVEGYQSVPVNNDSGAVLPADSIKMGSPNNLNSDARQTRVQSCRELILLRTYYIEKIKELRKAMDDLSGTEVLAYNLKTENMKYQYKFSDSCTDLINTTTSTRLAKIPREACVDLASVDDALYNTIIPDYDATNVKLYTEEIRIQDNLNTINDTIELTGCDVSGFSFSADDDVGTINTEELRAKLNELSPYYISPGTLDFVTTYLVGNGILDTALFTSSEILKSVKSSLSFIKGISDKQFPP